MPKYLTTTIVPKWWWATGSKSCENKKACLYFRNYVSLCTPLDAAMHFYNIKVSKLTVLKCMCIKKWVQRVVKSCLWVTRFLKRNTLGKNGYIISDDKYISDNVTFFVTFFAYFRSDFNDCTLIICKGSSINHVVKFFGIFDPPSWSLLLNKAYVIKWSFGQLSTRFMNDP